MKDVKTYKVEVVSAEAYSMESDHFNVKNPKIGSTRYVRPHQKNLRNNREAHKIINRVWKKCVQVILDRNSYFHEEVFNKGLDAEEVHARMGAAEIDLTLEELNLINEYHGY